MALQLATPSHVYQRINDELSSIIAALSTPSDDGTLEQARKEAHARLTQYQTELRHQLTELEKNAEWKTFTIAFYGETGAGKSTLIETLRILLQEPEKLASQQKFRELKSQYGIGEENLQRLQQTVEQADAKLLELAQQINTALQRYEQPHRDALAALEEADTRFNAQKQQLESSLQKHELLHDIALGHVTQLRAAIAERKKAISLWKKFLILFKKAPEQPEQIALGHASSSLMEAATARDTATAAVQSAQQQAEQERLRLQQRLSAIASTRETASASLHAQQAEAEHSQRTLNQQHQEKKEQLVKLLEALEKQADGDIIGDGRADYTRHTQRYHLNFEGQPFALLDVPGIEGKEGLVLSEIERAVQTAHAVFYVTNQAAPPQTGEGEDQRKGTLEKIKEHLGAQTEVWTIFNKKITNPKHALSDRPLTSDDENASLSGLDEKMREQLGAHYREVFPLTALPAFLASTDHFMPDSQHAKRRDKMLADFSPQELLGKSRLPDFVKLLGDKLLKDANTKITRSNFNKAKQELDQAASTLDREQKILIELSEKLNKDGKGAKRQLKRSFQSLQQRLDACGEILIDQFANVVRNDIYDRIDSDISNDDFKSALKNKIESKIKKLSKQLPNTLGEEVKLFQEDTQKIIGRFENQAKELTGIYDQLSSTKLNGKFDFKIKIDNGINVAGLVSGIIGLAMAPFTGGASLWILGASAISVLISIAKAVGSFFSTNYKKSQQRKATDDNLRKATEQLRESLRNSLEDAYPKMQHVIGQIEQALDAPAKQASAQAQALARSADQLKVLSLQINNAGSL